LVATNKKDQWFFLYGFAKNERSNIDKDEEEALKELAAQLLSFSQEQLVKAENKGELIEVMCDAQNEVGDS
jgi:hypothetical protein